MDRELIMEIIIMDATIMASRIIITEQEEAAFAQKADAERDIIWARFIMAVVMGLAPFLGWIVLYFNG